MVFGLGREEEEGGGGLLKEEEGGGEGAMVGEGGAGNPALCTAGDVIIGVGDKCIVWPGVVVGVIGVFAALTR